jgi:hypothetical protein
MTFALGFRKHDNAAAASKQINQGRPSWRRSAARRGLALSAICEIGDSRDHRLRAWTREVKS